MQTDDVSINFQASNMLLVAVNISAIGDKFANINIG